MHAKSALEFMTDNTANEQDQNAGNSRVAEYLSTKKTILRHFQTCKIWLPVSVLGPEQTVVEL